MGSPEVFQWKGTEEHFIKCFELFRQRSGEVREIINSLRSSIPSALESILDETNPKGGVNILSIGSGDGDMDIEILKIVNEEMRRNRPSHALKIFNQAVEPNVHALNQYKNTVATRLPKELSNASIMFDIDRPRTFEEYVANIKETVEFDIIHFIHSIYHITDVEKALKHCYEKELGNRGAIVLILIGKDDTFEVLKQRMCGISHVGNEIVDAARKNGWCHEVYRQETSIDVTDVFDEESIDGNMLLDFIAHTQNFRFNGHPDNVNIALQCIKELSVFQNGRLLAKMCADTHIIFK